MKTTERKLIAAAYRDLDILNNQTWNAYRDDLFDLCKAEEKQHRGSRGDGYNASIADCARMFVVRDICAYLTGERGPLEVKDFLSYRRSCFMACALVQNYRQEIEKALAGHDVKALAALDYVEVIK